MQELAPILIKLAKITLVAILIAAAISFYKNEDVRIYQPNNNYELPIVDKI